jgi:hypothetical protein
VPGDEYHEHPRCARAGLIAATIGSWSEFEIGIEVERADVLAVLPARVRVCKLAQPWSSGPVTADNYYCGTLTGHVFAPIDTDIDGTFAMIRVGSSAVLPEPPPID